MQKPTIRAPSETFDPHFEVTAEVGERLRRIERLDHDVGLLYAGGGADAAMLRHALSYNAYGTASMEGNPLSLEEVQSVLAQGPTPDNLRSPDEREIVNWAAFIEAIADHPVPRTVADVEALHQALFEGVMSPEQGLGRIKERANFIGRRDGTVIYVPTTPERAAQELQAALDWYHDDGPGANAASAGPLVAAWLFHVEFEAIHPFIDGNGRLGRALMTLMLHHAGYPGVRHALVDYAINRDRQDYYDALQQAQRDPSDLTPWLGYASSVFETAYVDAVARLTVQGEADLNPRQAQVAAWLLRVCQSGRRVAFGDVHAAFPHVARRTLQEDLKRLVAAGFLDLKGVRRGATYGVAGRRGA
ncbi:MAG: Fic family protein [Thermoplasmatota archaeon]